MVMFTLYNFKITFCKILQVQIHSQVVDPQTRTQNSYSKSNLTELIKIVTPLQFIISRVIPSCCACTGEVK